MPLNLGDGVQNQYKSLRCIIAGTTILLALIGDVMPIRCFLQVIKHIDFALLVIFAFFAQSNDFCVKREAK